VRFICFVPSPDLLARYMAQGSVFSLDFFVSFCSCAAGDFHQCRSARLFVGGFNALLTVFLCQVLSDSWYFLLRGASSPGRDSILRRRLVPFFSAPAFVPSFLYQAGFLLHAQHDLGSCARLDLASGLGFRVGFPVAESCLIFHLSHRGFVSPFDLEPRTIRRRSVCPELWSSCGFWSRAGVRARLCLLYVDSVPACRVHFLLASEGRGDFLVRA
jgi:hypothetical protein